MLYASTVEYLLDTPDNYIYNNCTIINALDMVFITKTDTYCCTVLLL